MTQPTLFAAPEPPGPPAGIDLRHGDVVDVLSEVRERGLTPSLIVSDSPWSYDQRHGASAAEDHYEGLEIDDIVDHHRLAYEAVGKHCRLALWITWPVLAADWPDRLPGWGRGKTGGSWFKTDEDGEGHYGQGFHWAGCNEPVLVYTKGSPPCNRAVKLRNCSHAPPGAHSRKPVAWQADWIRRWTEPDDLVLDLYAGLGSVAEACMMTGRRYLGAEIRKDRHRDAVALLAQVR